MGIITRPKKVKTANPQPKRHENLKIQVPPPINFLPDQLEGILEALEAVLEAEE